MSWGDGGVRLVGTSTFGPLYEIDIGSGSVARIDEEADYASQIRISMAFDPHSGSLLVVNNSIHAPRGIEQFNSETGLYEPRLAFTSGAPGYPGIAFGDAGVLYAQQAVSAIGAKGPIGTLDLDSGSFTALTLDVPRLFAFSYRRQDGFFYGITENNKLFSVNPTTGSIGSMVPLSGEDLLYVGSMSFLPNGQGLIAYGTSKGGRLAQLDVTDGSVSNAVAMASGTWPNAMAVIPEPSGSVLLTIGLLTISVAASRRGRLPPRQCG